MSKFSAMHTGPGRQRVLLPALLAVAALSLGACATTPKPLAGKYNTLTPAHASDADSGAQVRWGGQIIKTKPEPDKTCFYILSATLDKQARPEADSQGQGRFVACHDGFYDPEVFTRGREVTFTGTVSGSVTHKVGEYDYDYPKLVSDTVYLWPKRPDVVHVRRPYYPGSVWGPSPYWGPAWGPGWYPYSYFGAHYYPWAY